MGSTQPPLEILQQCMKQTSAIRNVCILAHVDHGKTTIADSLLATNRLISKRMAGLMRYLDDRLDEQERGITMKSSAVALLNLVEDPITNEETPLLLNLIDTPGHIDFSSEVGAALRVSDGALLVVDLVEGVCVQTREAIKLAFTERCKMILILNKLDKLILELNKDINEVFLLITHAIENCNAIIAELYQYEYLNSDVDIEDTGLLFSPEQGNVIFASAIDGWGFTTEHFAKTFLKVIKNETISSLNQKLWNFDAYADSKTNTIKFGAIEKGRTNLFTQLILKTVSHIYTTIITQMQKNKVPQIAEKLNIKILTREMTHNDSKVQLKAIMQAWSPLAEAIMLQVTKIISPPGHLQDGTVRYLLDFERFYENDEFKTILETVADNLQNCQRDSQMIAYVSKMFCVDAKNLSQNKPKVFVPRPRGSKVEEKIEEKEKEVTDEIRKPEFSIIALARVFSGTLRIGDEIYIINPQFTPGDCKNYQTLKITELYMLFGRELVLVDEITAGNICGIGGLESGIVRTATLCSTLDIVPFIEHPSQAPIVRNAIEPSNPKDLQTLRTGLRLLMQSDSCVQVVLQESGEHVLLTAGDVHLAKCLEDLTKIFAKIEINVSSPMVSLRETIATDYRKDLDNVIVVEVFKLRLTLLALSLPEVISQEIEKHYKILTSLEEEITGFELQRKRDLKHTLSPPQLKNFKSEVMKTQLKHSKEAIAKAFEHAGDLWLKLFPKLWNIGKISDSINILLNQTGDYNRWMFETLDESDERSCYDHFITNAFNAACKSGPLCEEPLKNCAFLVQKFELIDSESLDGTMKSNNTVETTLTAAFRAAFEKQQQRLMEPMFTTTIQVNTMILGKVYSVVNKRHGKVLEAIGMDEQEKSFLVTAQIPVVESTGFANEMRKTTSGQAIPTLKFSHFEVIDGDPFYQPQEEEDDDEDSTDVDSAVRATKLRKAIRRRKGLYVDEQVVLHGAKQRTLNKKK